MTQTPTQTHHSRLTTGLTTHHDSSGREIIVGVTGGVAAYKTAALVSKLVQSGSGVTVVLTKAAEHFVGAATFAALTGRPVAREIFDEGHFPLGAHITLAERARLLVVAPASADLLAKAAHGLADDLLSTCTWRLAARSSWLRP
jgi:phosphopantothenoylcysteine decarboxylase